MDRGLGDGNELAKLLVSRQPDLNTGCSDLEIEERSVGVCHTLQSAKASNWVSVVAVGQCDRANQQRS